MPINLLVATSRVLRIMQAHVITRFQGANGSVTNKDTVWSNNSAQEKWCCSCLAAIGILVSCVVLIACFRIELVSVYMILYGL